MNFCCFLRGTSGVPTAVRHLVSALASDCEHRFRPLDPVSSTRLDLLRPFLWERLYSNSVASSPSLPIDQETRNERSMALTATVSATATTEAGQQDTPSSSSKVVMLSTGLSTPEKIAAKAQMSAKPPSSSSAPSPLDALLSPTYAPENGMQAVLSTVDTGPSTSVPHAKEDAPTRSPGEPLDGDMQELSLEEVDETHFSTVPLSAPPPLSPSPPLTRKSRRLSSISRNDGTEDEQSLQTPRTSFSYFQDARGTKAENGKLEDGPANAHGSANGLPGADFILARLEKDSSKAFRSSMDGKAKLKEEFDSTRKLAEEREEKSKEIDWGTLVQSSSRSLAHVGIQTFGD